MFTVIFACFFYGLWTCISLCILIIFIITFLVYLVFKYSIYFKLVLTYIIYFFCINKSIPGASVINFWYLVYGCHVWKYECFVVWFAWLCRLYFVSCIEFIGCILFSLVHYYNVVYVVRRLRSLLISCICDFECFVISY